MGRIKWIDSCKGLAILLVVLGHVADGYIQASVYTEYSNVLQSIYNVIYAFHMPLFYCISGYVFFLAYCKKRIEKTKKYRIQLLNLIYIYGLFSLAIWVIKMLFPNNVNTVFSLEDLLLIPLKPLGEYWYIYCLIFMYLLAYFLENRYDYRIVLLVSFGVSCIVKLFSIGLSFPIGNIIFYFVFFYFGVALAKSKIWEMNKRLSSVIGVICFIIALVSWGTILFCDVSLHLLPIVSTVVGLAFCILIFSVFQFIGEIKILSHLGTYSLEIYTIHTFVTAANRSILVKIGITNFFANIVTNFILGVFIPVIMAKALKKLKIHKWVYGPFEVKCGN